MDYIWIIATLCAFFVKGLCGFANSLIFTSALSFSQSNINISPVELVLGYPSNLLQAWKGRANIKWKLCIPPSVLILLGNIPGILFLKNANVQGLKVFLGFVVAAIGIEMLLRDLSTKKWKESKILLAVIGILSGISLDDLRFAILAEDSKTISKIPGIGPKTAAKLVLELKDKFKLEDAIEAKLIHGEQTAAEGKSGKAEAARAAALQDEAAQALVALGYSMTGAVKVLKEAEITNTTTVEDLLKYGLKNL